MGLGQRLEALEEARYMAALAELRAAYHEHTACEIAPEFEGYFDTIAPDELARTDANADALEVLVYGDLPNRTAVDAAATVLASAVDLPRGTPPLVVLHRLTEELKRPPVWRR